MEPRVSRLSAVALRAAIVTGEFEEFFHNAQPKFLLLVNEGEGFVQRWIQWKSATSVPSFNSFWMVVPGTGNAHACLDRPFECLRAAQLHRDLQDGVPLGLIRNHR